MLGWWRRRRRARWLAEPPREEWRAVLLAQAPFFGRLSVERQDRLLRTVRAFLVEHPVVGAGGMEVDEAMAVVVGACAARLVLDLDLEHYHRLTEVVLYPYDELVDPRDQGRLLGAAHRHGAVVLSWPAVQRGLRAPRDGLDTAVHEFAHALDLADGVFDGAPALRAAEDYRPWAEHLGAAYAGLQRGDKRLLRVLRPYGGTAPPELFAVATEAFFERPEELRRRAPKVHAALERFYRGR